MDANMDMFTAAGTAGPAGTMRRCRVGVARVAGAYRVIATEPIETGEPILVLQGTLVDHPTRYSIQVDQDRHLEADGGSDPVHENGHDWLVDRHPWRFLNHACNPNAVIRGREVVAIRPIAAWEEIHFNYNTTEYEISCPFPCGCEHPSCRGEPVRGFRYLSSAERKRLGPWLAEHLVERADLETMDDPTQGPASE
jgi:SET domain-containing protein